MAHDHARINLAIWGDDDFTDELSPAAQHLYFALWTSPGRSYCGTGNWHPGRLTQLARGWTVTDVEAAAAELSAHLFLIVDPLTDEYLLRSWIKHDGLWRTPNMAVSVAMARLEVASKTLRGVIVHEVRKLAAANPDAAGWKRPAVVDMLAQKSVDPGTLVPFQASATPPVTPALTLVAAPPVTPELTPPVTLRSEGANPPANPCANPGANPGPTTATTTATATYNGGYVSRERYDAHANRPGNEPPSPSSSLPLAGAGCAEHPGGTSEPCAGCRAARLAAEQSARDHAAQAAADHRAARDADIAARRAAIAACQLCNADGYRGTVVCDHVERDTTAGRAAARAALRTRTPK